MIKPLLHIILYQPQIPPNTGNIIRLCANTGCALHLIHPLGFDASDKQMRRAGLDYHQLTLLENHENWEAFLTNNPCKRLFALTTKGSKPYHEIEFQPEDGLLFGPETSGLPQDIRESQAVDADIRIPMQATSRSLNLSNSVAIVAYEAMRQLNFSTLT